MANIINRQQTFSTNGTVTASGLHNLIDTALVNSAIIKNQQEITTIGTADLLLIAPDSVDASLAPRKVTVQNLLDDGLTAGTFTSFNLTGNLTYGTATGNRTVSTTATISTATIPNLTAGTTTSTAATITTGTIPALTTGTTTSTAEIVTSGTIATLNSTTGTITTALIPTGTFGTTTSTAATITTGTIPNLTTGTTTSTNEVVTNGTITNLFATTSTFLGTITGSTNVINIGSGQIYKDASGNVGIGTASPSVKLNVSGGTRSVIKNDSSGTTVNEYSQSINYAGNGAYLLQNLVYGNGYCVTAANPAVGQVYEISTTSSSPIVFVANNTERMRIGATGDVTIAGLAGSGSRAVNASAAGLLSAASDASLKEEVVGAHIAGLNEILQIHPKMYRWKDDIANRGDEASVELGFIANDVAPIIPSAAPIGNDGLYGFYDRSITAALVKAVQELKSENDSLKSRIEALEAK